MKQFSCVFISILFYSHCHGQSLSGLWKGSTEHSFWLLNSTSDIMEMEIFNDSLVTGIVHSYYKKGRFAHTKISGTINWKDSSMVIVDEDEISSNVNDKFYENCPGTMQLKLTRWGNAYHLDGKWKDKSKKLFHCPTVAVSFEKPYEYSAELVKTDSPGTRKTAIQQLIELSYDEVDSIKLALFDNGEIDNDTVTLYLNDSLIIKNQRLSERPVEFYLSLDKRNPVQKIKLFADNLGSIPPNTALLVITTRKSRYQITLSSNYEENGSVEFFLKD